jgi:hypothetical protein
MPGKEFLEQERKKSGYGPVPVAGGNGAEFATIEQGPRTYRRKVFPRKASKEKKLVCKIKNDAKGKEGKGGTAKVLSSCILRGGMACSFSPGSSAVSKDCSHPEWEENEK